MTTTLADLDRLATGLPEAAHAALMASQRLLSALASDERGRADNSVVRVGRVECRQEGGRFPPLRPPSKTSRRRAGEKESPR